MIKRILGTVTVKKPTFYLRLLQLVPVALLLAGVVALISSGDAQAFNLSLEDGAEAARGVDHPEDLFSGDGSIFATITNILLFLVGAIAVIMLVIGGIRYVVSGGDQGAVTAAKNTILYAIVGIVVAFLAYAAVQFVIGSLSGSTSSA